MKKSIFVYLSAVILCTVTVVCGAFFLNSHIGEAVLTEETVTGSREAADGLSAGFRSDAGEQLHWVSRFDYSAGGTESSFRRGKMPVRKESSVYEDIRFTGWEAEPFTTQIEYGDLGNLQNQKLHAHYDKLQREALKTGEVREGKLHLKDYLDYYPVSFRFQFGSKIYNMKNALTGLKVYDERDMLSDGYGLIYADEITLYKKLNQNFKIPVIENEYQEYRISPAVNYDPKKEPGYETEIEKPQGKGEDFYQFDPVIVLQEENIMDGKHWEHPDTSGSLSYKAGGEQEKNAGAGDDEADRKASDYGLKNRLLFIVNNKTAKGAPVDVSGFEQGFGIYELPIDTSATATVKLGKRSRIEPAPKPLTEELDMVFSLDETAEYIESSLSEDHRYLAVFSVKDGCWYAELVDADFWTSKGPVRMFSASDKMSYAWGEDGSLAVTNHKGAAAIFARTGDQENPYEMLYSGTPEGDFAKVFFDGKMTKKAHDQSRYRYGMERGLALCVKDGKAALVQSLPAGDGAYKCRNAGLVCAVIDKTGILYTGTIRSEITDAAYDMSDAEMQSLRDLSESRTGEQLIAPVENENRVRWQP